MKKTSKSRTRASGTTRKQGNVKLPFLSKKEFGERTARRKPKAGKSVNLGKVHDPSGPVALAKKAGKGGGPVANPKRRGRILCRVYGPEELLNIFGVASDYGGMVCTRH
jgi:hypothetical protein